jgi:hypothetical protein
MVVMGVGGGGFLILLDSATEYRLNPGSTNPGSLVDPGLRLLPRLVNNSPPP